MRTPFFIKGQTGASLISVIISIGLVGMLSTTLMKMHANTFSLHKKASIDDDRLGMKIWIRKAVSCEKTYEALGQSLGSCGSFLEKDIDLYRSNNEVLVSKDGSKHGNWAIKATCSHGGINVKVAYIGQAGSLSELKKENIVFRDPLTREPLDFEHPKNQLFTDSLLCNESVGASQPDLECVSAFRDKNRIVAEKAGVVEPITENTPSSKSFYWGLRCTGRYNRMSCFMSSYDDFPTDMDLWYRPRACVSDDEEWNGNHQLSIVCCKLRD